MFEKQILNTRLTSRTSFSGIRNSTDIFGGELCMKDNCIFGYCRVSSRDQNLDRQIQRLVENGVEERNIVKDEQSGKDFQREGYLYLKEHALRNGDTLVLTEFDRLGRNYDEIKKEYQELTDRGIIIRFLDNEMLGTYNKSDIEKKLIANFMLELLAYISEKERLKIRQRCDEGIQNAKKQGIKFGRPAILLPSNWNEVISLWRNGEITAVKAMELTKLKRTTFYKLAKQTKTAEEVSQDSE